MEDSRISLSSFTDIFTEDKANSQPLSLSSKSNDSITKDGAVSVPVESIVHRPAKHTGQYREFRSIDEIDQMYRDVFSYPFFNLVQSRIIEDALYSDKSLVVCAPTGSGKTVAFEMAIVQLLMQMQDQGCQDDFKIIYMAPVKAVCTERLTEWYPKFTKLGLLCIEVTGDTDVDFSQLKPYRIIITTPEKWDILTRRWTDYRGLVEVIKLFLIDEVHILNDELRGPVLEAVVSRMKTIEASSQSAYRIEQLQKQYQEQGQYENQNPTTVKTPPRIRFVAVSATVSNPEDVADWLGTEDKKAEFHKFGDECRPVKLKRIVEGYSCSEGTSIFKFDLILNYKLWPIIQKYYNGKPTLIFCNTRKSVMMTAETLAKELTVSFNPEQRAKLAAIASTIKNKKIQMLVANGVGCHHAGLLFEERASIEQAFRQRDLPILITTTTLAMGVNLPAHLVIIKNTQQYIKGAYQEYSISTVLQMVGRAGRPQFDTEATAVIMTRSQDKPRYQSLVGGSEPLQSYLHKRLTENLNSEAALRTVTDVAQCVEWLRSTFLYVRAAKEPRRYLGLPHGAPSHLILKKIEELCVKAMNGLASAGLITMDEACCIESTMAGRLMSVYYLDFETMKLIMKIEGSESLEQLLLLVCDSHELADMHLRVDERRSLNTLNRNNSAPTIRYPMKGKISTRQMKVNCVIQAVLGCLPIPDPSLLQEATKIMRIADRVCKCLVAYVTRPNKPQPQQFSAILNSIVLAKCIVAHLWENSPYVSKQMRGIGPTFSTLLATAGKSNFMLLEESHPRDLERIMNKGPPAGNVLHKQILLLPKYQITLTPVDENAVTVQVMLLNQHYLANNMNNLTAGENHKCFIIVGDSENYILLQNSFKDKDLIGVYDGCITHTITRRHRFKHKILVHCVSSTFVGIDVQNEYQFEDLDPVNPCIQNTTSKIDNTPKKRPIQKRQTSIKDTFKERKRKADDLDISHSKEKIKRHNSILDKFKYLKESFGYVTKEINGDLKKTADMNNTALYNITNQSRMAEVHFAEQAQNIASTSMQNKEYNRHNLETEVIDNSDYDSDDKKFDSIMNEIESEINNNNGRNSDLPNLNVTNPTTEPIGLLENFNVDSVKFPRNDNQVAQRRNIPSNQRTKKKLDNFKFIKILEKNIDLSDDDVEEVEDANKQSGFSDAIKSEIQKFLQKAQSNVQMQNTAVEQLILTQENYQNINDESKHLQTRKDPEIVWLDKEQNESSVIILQEIVDISTENIDKDEHCNSSEIKQTNQEGAIEVFNETGNTTSSILPDVILVHRNDKSLSKTLNVAEEPLESKELSPPKTVEDANPGANIISNDLSEDVIKNNNPVILKPPSIEQLLQYPEFEKDSLKHQESNNLVNDRDNKTVIETECQRMGKKWLPLHNKKCYSGMNNTQNQRAFESDQHAETKLLAYNDDVIMLSAGSKEYFNNISQDINKISITDSNQPVEVAAKQYTISNSFNIKQNNDKITIKDEVCKTSTKNYEPSSSSGNALFSQFEDVEFSRKYSYTNTKIDIITKQCDSKKFTFKTINKMKVDLDITQIVSVENQDSPNNSNNIKEVHSSNFNSSYHTDLVKTTPVFQRKFTQDFQYETKTCVEKKPFQVFTSALALTKVPVIKSAPVYRQDVNTNNKNNGFNLESQIFGQMEFSNSAAKSTQKEMETKKSVAIMQRPEDQHELRRVCEPKQVNKNHSKVQEACAVASPDNKTEPEKHRPVIEELNLTGAKQSVSACPDNGTSSINSILQKYARIFNEKSAPSHTQSSSAVENSQSQQAKTDEAKSLTKPKRPFRIKDIQNIKAKIPTMIIKDISPPTPLPVKRNLMEPIDPVVEAPEPQIQEQVTTATDSSVNLEIVELECPDDLEDDLSTRISQVDHCMFNPKMLLEQYHQSKDDEEYIQPPPEFCDEELYSPTQNVNDIDNTRNNFFEVKDSIYKELYHNNEYFDGTNFETPHENEQTQAQLETLSQEDRIDLNYPSDLFYNLHPSRREHRNPSANSRASNKRATLDQFKFGKKRFNLRK